jgi:hypothetical protein
MAQRHSMRYREIEIPQAYGRVSLYLIKKWL